MTVKGKNVTGRRRSYRPFVRVPRGRGFRLVADKDSILQLREEHGVAYKRSFPGCHLIDWLLQNGEIESRGQGVELCRALLEQGIIQHGKLRPSSQPIFALVKIYCNQSIYGLCNTKTSLFKRRALKNDTFTTTSSFSLFPV